MRKTPILMRRFEHEMYRMYFQRLDEQNNKAVYIVIQFHNIHTFLPFQANVIFENSRESFILYGRGLLAKTAHFWL
jgi:hypothetical protein